jgi:hypothetical protein
VSRGELPQRGSASPGLRCDFQLTCVILKPCRVIPANTRVSRPSRSKCLPR